MHNRDDLLKQVAAGFANMTTAEIDAFIKNAKLTAAQAKRANSKAARAQAAKRLLLDGKLINFLLNQTTGEKIFLDAKTWAEKRDKFLTSNADRALFGLRPLTKAPPPKKCPDLTKSPDDSGKTPEARNSTAGHAEAAPKTSSAPPAQKEGRKAPPVSLDDFENP